MLKTATAILALLISATPVLAEDWGSFYAEIYGGGHLAGTAVGNGVSYPINAGASYGAAIGLMTPVPGLAFGLDVMGTSAGYTSNPAFTLNTITVMVEAEYTVPLNEMFEIYGAAGVGSYHIAYNDPNGTSSTGWGPGYQLAIGARANVTENVSITGEIKHQNSFSAVNINGTAGLFAETYATTSGLIGLRFAMN